MEILMLPSECLRPPKFLCGDLSPEGMVFGGEALESDWVLKAHSPGSRYV